MSMPLDNNNPTTQIGENGHVVSTDNTIIKEVVVFQPEDSQAVRNVSNNINMINQVAGDLAIIENVNNSLPDIQEILPFKESIKDVAKEKFSIRILSNITDDLQKLALNTDSLTMVIDNLDLLENLDAHSEEYRFLWDIREHIVNINNLKEKLLQIVNNMYSIETNSNNIGVIDLVASHMLAVEIVAQNIELLRFFNDNTILFEQTVQMYPDLVVFLENLDTARELINIVTTLPQTIDEFRADLTLIATNLTESFTTRADEKLEEMKQQFDEFMRKSLLLKERILDLEKDFTDFRLQHADDLQEVKNDVDNRVGAFREDFVGIVNDIEEKMVAHKNGLTEQVVLYENKMANELVEKESELTNLILTYKQEVLKEVVDCESRIEEHTIRLNTEFKEGLTNDFERKFHLFKDEVDESIRENKEDFSQKVITLNENIITNSNEVKENVHNLELNITTFKADIETRIAALEAKMTLSLHSLEELQERITTSVTQALQAVETSATSILTIQTTLGELSDNIAQNATDIEQIKQDIQNLAP